MKRKSYRLHWLVFAVSIVGLFISIYPFAPGYNSLRPEIMCLIVIFWVTNFPQYFGVFFAWSIGFVQDIVEGVVWGSHAIGLSIIAYICLVAYQRIKNYSVWHQTMWVFVLVGFHQVIVNWVQGLGGYKAGPLDLFFSSVISALFWPLLFFWLTRVRTRYRLN